MPAVITRLRIAGFKSFAEPTSIDILPGLTGIVGPNGCGKSNVVEALRWAMGETSARSLRGGEMDEVIFAGSAARPSRDIAEVVVTLEEAAGLAPAPLQSEHELQVSRRIERGAGSTYRVNGREMRARDVQTMFADIASGARSSAMVSQGRVAFLVDARPEERRSVLEEAAGITGLHARRHEAELRLRAAEANLTRVADLRSSLESQSAALTRQAEAARRYREAVGELSAAEAALLGIMLGRAARAVEASRQAMEAARRGLAATTQAARDATADEAAAEAASGEAGGEAARAAALLERARAALEAVRADEARALEAVEQATARLDEVTQDHARATREVEAADRSAEMLAAEAEALRLRLEGADERIARARATREEATAAANRETDRQAARVRAAEDVDALVAAAAAADARCLAIAEAIVEARRAAPSAETLEALARASDEAARALDRTRATAASDEAALRAGEDALAAMLRDAAAARDAASRACAMREEIRARVERIAAEHERVLARCAQAEAAQVGPGSVARANEAASVAREAAEAAEAALGNAEREAERAALDFQAARDAAAMAGSRAREAASALTTACDECARLETRRVALAAEHDAAGHGIAPPGALEAARAAVEDARTAIEIGRSNATIAEHGREAARVDAAASRDAIASLRAELMALRTELAALSASTGESDISLLDSLSVPAPLERALAAGLGDALASSLDLTASRHWRELGALAACPPLPGGSVAFERLIAAPAPLSRALSQLGLLDEGVDGALLQRDLVPGQILVGLDGSLFRWDGHTARGGKSSAIEEKLRARRRSRECEAALTKREVPLPALEAALLDALARASRGEDLAREARQAIEAGEAMLSASAGALTALEARDARALARADGIGAELARVGALRAEAEARAEAAREALAAAGDVDALATTEAAAQSHLAEAVSSVRTARDAVRDAAAMSVEMEAEARRLAARAAETTALLDAIEPAAERLGTERSQAGEVLAAAEHDAGEATARTEALAADASTASEAAGRLRGAVRVAREAVAEADRTLSAARTSHEEAAGRARETAVRLELLEPEHRAATRDTEAIRARLDAASSRRQAIGPEDGALEAARRADSESQRACAALEADTLQARDRLGVIEGDTPVVARRRDEARARLDELIARLDGTRRTHAETVGAPPIVAERLRQATSRFEAAQAEAAEATEAASSGAARLFACRDRRRAAEEAASAAREALSRVEAAELQAAEAAREVDERVREATVTVEIVPDPGSGAETEARRRLARAVRARDEIGPVNLLAESEADEVAGRLATLAAEADELEMAIGRLRGSIGHLNREGRERLQASFVQIDAQFRALFGRMFDGGRAHLALVGSEDPLQAGLEIYAQPPGKKLSTLSLLSGGEQALTALSLIFAVFRCNPAPVCVLDEVDAPLDDANVERFCRLVADMTKETGTRFLVVTHHQLTMANMDRLYGVTMQERGVSRLLSVDLGRAVALVS